MNTMPLAFWQITTEALQVGWLLAGLGALAAGLGIFRVGRAFTKPEAKE
jgi:hypothetical protein